MTMNVDEIAQQELILQEIIKRHMEKQDQMRKDEELARQMNFNQVLEAEAVQARRDLETSQNPYHSTAGDINLGKTNSNRLQVVFNYKMQKLGVDKDFKTPNMLDKLKNAFNFNDDASKRDFKGWAVTINGSEALDYASAGSVAKLSWTIKNQT